MLLYTVGVDGHQKAAHELACHSVLWYLQNTPKWSFYHHFRKPLYSLTQKSLELFWVYFAQMSYFTQPSRPNLKLFADDRRFSRKKISLRFYYMVGNGLVIYIYMIDRYLLLTRNPNTTLAKRLDHSSSTLSVCFCCWGAFWIIIQKTWKYIPLLHKYGEISPQ